jgi:hypothetical protein
MVFENCLIPLEHSPKCSLLAEEASGQLRFSKRRLMYTTKQYLVRLGMDPTLTSGTIRLYVPWLDVYPSEDISMTVATRVGWHSLTVKIPSTWAQ